jgi:hypothetical protein
MLDRIVHPWASGIILGWDTLRGLLRYVRRNRRDLTPAKRLELRQKWKQPFEEFFRANTHKKLSTEIVIRNIKRLDEYPDVTEKGKKGISPWFRTDLVQTYERGLMVSIMIGELVSIGEDKWRFRDWINREEGETFWLIGFIPYENVGDVNWGKATNITTIRTFSAILISAGNSLTSG